MDSTTKQYILFSFVVSIVISLIANFIIINGLKGTMFYGVPISLVNASGFGEFIIRIINSLVMALFLTLPMYWFMIWAYKRVRG